jgi:hypothetical protein
MKLELYRQVFEKYSIIQSFIKIPSVGAELFRADRRTDMTKLVVIFRNFAKSPNKQTIPSRNNRTKSLS